MYAFGIKEKEREKVDGGGPKTVYSCQRLGGGGSGYGYWEGGKAFMERGEREVTAAEAAIDGEKRGRRDRSKR